MSPSSSPRRGSNVGHCEAAEGDRAASGTPARSSNGAGSSRRSHPRRKKYEVASVRRCVGPRCARHALLTGMRAMSQLGFFVHDGRLQMVVPAIERVLVLIRGDARVRVVAVLATVTGLEAVLWAR